MDIQLWSLLSCGSRTQLRNKVQVEQCPQRGLVAALLAFQGQHACADMPNDRLATETKEAEHSILGLQSLLQAKEALIQSLQVLNIVSRTFQTLVHSPAFAAGRWRLSSVRGQQQERLKACMQASMPNSATSGSNMMLILQALQPPICKPCKA